MAAQVAMLLRSSGLAPSCSCSCSCDIPRSVSSPPTFPLLPSSINNPSKMHSRTRHTRLTVPSAKKRWWLDDPFDYGPDAEEDTMGELMSQGPQSAEDPKPPPDENSEFGYLDFPAGFMPEIASLGTLIRNDVRKCLCIVAGEVYENLLFFPVIQLVKNRYPGVKVDVMATPRGKQTYEINKNVRKAWVHPVEDRLLKPVEFAESMGTIKGQYYDMVLSTKQANLGHSIYMWLADIRNKISYIHPDADAGGALMFLDVAINAPQAELAESGFNMYAEMIDVVSQMGKYQPRTELPPLEVAVSKKVRAFVEAKCREAGVTEGPFLVFHGLLSDSSASMTSKGDTDSLLPLGMWAEIAKSTSEKVVFVIPNEKERVKVKEVCGEDALIVFITTPGQLTALISASLGVVTTNTAALQLAIAMKKPTVALFSSQAKAELFVPSYATDCEVVASKTNELSGLDLKAATMALSTLAKDPVLAA